MRDQKSKVLRRGWTTGACATAAARAAYTALLTGEFPDPVVVRLPRGQEPAFALARQALDDDRAMAGVIKDAGDDPDVTHGALVMVTVRAGARSSGVTFKAGEGVGTVTKPGLPVAVGEPAINPVPRRMMQEAIAEVAAEHGGDGDVEIEISVADGAELARSTWNPRLGIEGGLSILGTSGIVVPFSCAAWIHSIHSGIDVARATGIDHVIGSTGPTSEATAQRHFDAPLSAMIDMGDFAGGMLKYLRRHPVPRVTIAGGFAKLSKLALGFLDLHSGRSQVDLAWLSEQARALGADEQTSMRIREGNTAAEALSLAEARGLLLADAVAESARREAQALTGADVAVDVLIIDRSGRIVGTAGG